MQLPQICQKKAFLSTLSETYNSSVQSALNVFSLIKSEQFASKQKVKVQQRNRGFYSAHLICITSSEARTSDDCIIVFFSSSHIPLPEP